MTDFYAILDHSVESFLLNVGMSHRSTDFMMMLFGFGYLLVLGGIMILYIRLMLTSYLNMIQCKSKRLRRNWSVVFIIELVIAIVTVMSLLN